MKTNSMFCWDSNIDTNVQAYEKKQNLGCTFLNAVSSLDIQAHFAGVGLSKFPISCNSDESSEMLQSLQYLENCAVSLLH